MNLQSCHNCWFNGLQYGAVGLQIGYCSRHRKVLSDAEGTTCGLHLRKDLSLKRAGEVNAVHRSFYPVGRIVTVYEKKPANGAASDDPRDIATVTSDPVGSIAFDFGSLGSKIESLAMLERTPGVRAEIALSTLGRGYVANCVARNGRWTSGLHLYWWTKTRLASEPQVVASDLCATDGLRPSRQTALIVWSVVMLRLTLIDDIAEHAAAQGDPFGSARGLSRRAAEEVQTFDFQKLRRWILSKGLPALDRRLPYKSYVKLSRELHKDPPETHPGTAPSLYG